MEDNIFEKKKNFGNLLMMYIVLTAVGCVLSFAYIYANFYSPRIQLSIFFAFTFATVLSVVVKYSIKYFKIDNRLSAFITVVFAIVTFSYFKWNIFFGMHYLRNSYGFIGYEVNLLSGYADVMRYALACMKYPAEFFDRMIFFNNTGTWYYGDSYNVVVGSALWVIWGMEFVVITFAPIIASLVSYGVLCYDRDNWEWATPNFLGGPYDKFPNYNYDRLKEGDISSILELPISEKSNPMKAYYFAIFKKNDELTGTVAVYCFIRFKKKVYKFMSSKPIAIGKNLVSELENKLGGIGVESIELVTSVASESNDTIIDQSEDI